MLNDEYEATLSDLRRSIRARSTVIGLLCVAHVLISASLYRAIGSERTIVTPPNLTMPFWVQGHKYSNAYLEQMGGYVAWLILDVAPTSIEWKKKALLGLVSPEIVGKLKMRQELEGRRLRRLNASTYFLPQQFAPNEEKQSVRITGLMHTQINGQPTPPVPAVYDATFNAKGGRSHLAGFEEVKENGQASVARSGTPSAADDSQP